jgi:hypothetical protein
MLDSLVMEPLSTVSLSGGGRSFGPGETVASEPMDSKERRCDRDCSDGVEGPARVGGGAVAPAGAGEMFPGSFFFSSPHRTGFCAKIGSTPHAG